MIRQLEAAMAQVEAGELDLFTAERPSERLANLHAGDVAALKAWEAVVYRKAGQLACGVHGSRHR